MKKSFDILFQSPIVSLVGLGALFNIALWVLVMTTFPKDTPAAVLHYSVGVGIDFIGEGRQIMVLPIAGSMIFLANTIIAKSIWKASRRAGWILIGALPVAEGLLLLGYLILLRLNATYV